jgi:hypothetical protein
MTPPFLGNNPTYCRWIDIEFLGKNFLTNPSLLEQLTNFQNFAVCQYRTPRLNSSGWVAPPFTQHILYIVTATAFKNMDGITAQTGIAFMKTHWLWVTTVF